MDDYLAETLNENTYEILGWVGILFENLQKVGEILRPFNSCELLIYHKIEEMDFTAGFELDDGSRYTLTEITELSPK